MRRVALVILMATACAGAPPAVHLDGNWPERAPDYRDATRAWTRKTVVWRELQQVCDVSATLKSAEWRAAFVAEQARRTRMSRDAANMLAASERAAADAGWEVELLLATEKPDWNDLSKRERSMWRIALVGDDGREVLPTSVLADKRPHDVVRAWFPGKTHWHRAYTITFPRDAPDGRPLVGPGSPRIALRIGSALAGVELEWKTAR